jgi:hypothetical protein
MARRKYGLLAAFSFTPPLMAVTVFQSQKEAVEYAVSLFGAGAEWETHVKGF